MDVYIRSLHIYPVKGCAAVDVEEIEVDASGLLVGDRSLMVVDAVTGAFVSQRHVPALARLIARPTSGGHRSLAFDGGGAVDVTMPPAGPTRRVTVWDDTFDAIDCGDAVATPLSDWLGRAVRLVALPATSPRELDPFWAGDGRVTSFADLAPLLVTSAASLDDLNARRVERGLSPVAMNRFRPNVVIDGLDAWAEDGIARLSSTTYSLELIKPCARCKVIELDPSDGSATGDEVLASLAKFRAGKNRRGTAGVFFGQNAIVRGRGGWSLRVGETLTIERHPVS